MKRKRWAYWFDLELYREIGWAYSILIAHEFEP